MKQIIDYKFYNNEEDKNEYIIKYKRILILLKVKETGHCLDCEKIFIKCKDCLLYRSCNTFMYPKDTLPIKERSQEELNKFSDLEVLTALLLYENIE